MKGTGSSVQVTFAGRSSFLNVVVLGREGNSNKNSPALNPKSNTPHPILPSDARVSVGCQHAASQAQSFHDATWN